MLRLKVTFAVLGLIAAGILWASVSYAAPFLLGDSLDGGGPGATAPGSTWLSDFDTWACDSSLSGDVITDADLDPDDETAVIQSDAFDDGLQLIVDGLAFDDSDNTGDVVTDAGGQAATLGPEAMAGLQMTLEWKALTSTATIRTFATLQNTTGADIAVPISWETNLGSDFDTGVRGSSSGDLTFGPGDRWIVTSDDAVAPSDPVNTTVLFGPGSPDVTPSSIADLFTGCGGEEGMVAGYSVTVPAGQSRYLLFFNQMNQTNAEALAAATGFDANPATDSEFLSGISAQLPDILNWDFQVAGPTPTPTSVPTPTATSTIAASAAPTAAPSPTPALSPAPTARPASLPGTGDRPSGGGAPLELWAVVLAGVTLSAACACIVTAIRRQNQ